MVQQHGPGRLKELAAETNYENVFSQEHFFASVRATTRYSNRDYKVLKRTMSASPQ
jgi:hypothetical protein